jgi:hypothetical protein
MGKDLKEGLLSSLGTRVKCVSNNAKNRFIQTYIMDIDKSPRKQPPKTQESIGQTRKSLPVQVKKESAWSSKMKTKRKFLESLEKQQASAHG